jgi:hypothetical protein
MKVDEIVSIPSVASTTITYVPWFAVRILLTIAPPLTDKKAGPAVGPKSENKVYERVSPASVSEKCNDRSMFTVFPILYTMSGIPVVVGALLAIASKTMVYEAVAPL